MIWYRDYFVGKSIESRRKQVRKKLEQGKVQLEIYVITLASNENNLLDIIPSWNLLQESYPSRDLYVLGIAGGYHEALELAGEIVSRVYRETGGFRVAEYYRA